MKFLSSLIFMAVAISTTGQDIRFKADTQKSTVKWTGYYLFSFGEHYGTIDLQQGELTLKGNEITAGNFEIDMHSIKNIDMGEDGKGLSDHLMGEDFFEVDKFPKAHFKIEKTNKLEGVNPGDPDIQITGSLTLKGVTQTLVFPALIQVSNNEVIAKAKLKFDRTKWNVRYGSGKLFSDVGDNAISDAVGLELNLRFIKQ